MKDENTIARFNTKYPGYIDEIRGELQNKQLYIYGMKEPYYFLLFITTYGYESQTGREYLW